MKLGKHIFKVGAFTGVSRVFGFVRDMLIARVLGAGRLSDIFLASFKLPNLFRDLLGEGALSSVFVPMFADNKKEESFARNVFSWLMAILLGITIVGLIIMPILILVIAPGFANDPGKIEMTIIISRIMFLYLIFICGSAFLSAVLNAFSEFALVAFMPTLMNLFMIGGLFVAMHHSAMALYIMAAAVVLSGMTQMWILWRRLRARNFGIYLIRPKWNAPMKTMFKRLGVNILGSGFYQINIIIGTIVASFQAGAVSWLYYSDRMVQLPFAIIGLAAGTVLLTSISDAIANKNMRSVYIQQNSSMRNSMLWTLPCVVGLFVLARPIIKYLFEYGAWTPESTTAVAYAIMIQCLVLPAMVISQIYSKTLYAALDVKTPVKTSVVALIASSVIYVGAFPFIGFLSVPIGTVIGGYVKNAMLARACRRRDLFRPERRTIVSIAGFSALSVALGVGLWLAPVHSIYALGAVMILFGAIYLPTAYLINKICK
jgi:putative peptidoglycan lipid II flippase